MNNFPEIGHREEEKIQESGKSEEITEYEESTEDFAARRISQIEESARELKAEGDERVERANDTIHLPQEKVDEIDAKTQTSEKLDDLAKRAEDATKEVENSIRSIEKPPEKRGKLAESIAGIFNVPVSEIPRPEWWKWKKKGFDIRERLSQIDGPFVEVAGPTEKGYSIIKFDDLDKKVFVSNITPGATKFNIQTGEVIGLEGNVDLQADARELSFGDNKLGAVFCSCLGELHSAPGIVIGDKNQLERKLKLREDALKEIFRALKSEGILVWQGGMEDDVKFAQEIGFTVRQYETSNIATLYQNKERPSFNVVFEKERIEAE